MSKDIHGYVCRCLETYVVMSVSVYTNVAMRGNKNMKEISYKRESSLLYLLYLEEIST